MTIESVRQAFEPSLLRLPNVVSVGLGEKDGTKVIQVGVARKVPASALGPGERIPRSLGGYPVEVVELGRPTAEVQEELDES